MEDQPISQAPEQAAAPAPEQNTFNQAPAQPVAAAPAKQSMPGLIIAWFVLTPISGLFALLCSITGFSSLGDKSYGGSTTATSVILSVCFMLVFIYSIIAMILVGIRKSRLFIAISHLALAALMLIVSIIAIVQIAQISAYISNSYIWKKAFELASPSLITGIVIYFLWAGFFLGFGLGLVNSKKAKGYFGEQ